jgi:hypothetical protein
LAWLLIQQPALPPSDAKQALTIVNLILAKNKGQPVPPNWLELHACVLAANGDFNAAVGEAEKAKALYAELKEPKASARIESQIATFKQRRPWVNKPQH